RRASRARRWHDARRRLSRGRPLAHGGGGGRLHAGAAHLSRRRLHDLLLGLELVGRRLSRQRRSLSSEPCDQHSGARHRHDVRRSDRGDREASQERARPLHAASARRRLSRRLPGAILARSIAMSMKPSIAALGLGVVALSASPTSLAAPIPEYRALYRNVDEGAPGSADVSLTYDSVAGRYTLIVTRVDAVERESEKTLRFNLVDDKIRPLTYREEYGRCGSCTVAVTFDWDGRRYGHDSGGYQYVGLLTERDGSPSRVVRDVAMLVANLPGRRELAGGFDDVLTEKSLGTVELTTPLGSVRADGRALRWRDAAIWFARELDDLPVRIVAFGVGLELAELQGIELMVTRGATAFEDGVIATSPASGAPGIRFPEYRAAYRVDENRRVGAGRLETAVSYDLASDSYELVATATETKHPEDAQ